jgi:ATP-dependent RNA helicase DDX42
VSFGHLPLTEGMLKIISQLNFEHPTPIQSQALPCAFSGRDVVGIAKTGSGKTLAYVWPMLVHVGHRMRKGRGDGPSALVLAPTR